MPDLPSGTVTFLFTDIEGSTRLWERDPAVMDRALLHHNAILDDTITAHGGVHFKTIGDAFQAAFREPSDAAAAAVAAQRALAAEPWRETGPIRVRMALHLGEASPDAVGDYLAPCLNRLARLLATGFGGQVLLSEAVEQRVHECLPAAVTLRALGRHRLRDLLEPEQVAQLVIPGLPDTFPPLKSLEGYATNLPVLPTALIGRERELADVSGLLRDSVRLATLIGPGGVGKTHLALQAAADGLELFADGVWLVSLGELTDAALVLPHIAATLGVREGGGLNLREVVVAYLARKRTLLLLDNFEQLLDAAPAVATLLGRCPNLQLLVTSRQRLGIGGERLIPVEPLPVPERRAALETIRDSPAVQLFLERAATQNPHFQFDDEVGRIVAGICARLDGLPLAIELAAAQLAHYTPRELISELENRFGLLTGGRREALSHQQTLAATIAWSYDRLPSNEQRVFRALSVFAGGWRRAAAAAVLESQDGPDISVTHVAALVEASLARRVPIDADESRWTMLESIREFGRQRLDGAAEGDRVRERHAAWCLDFAEAAAIALEGADQASWLDQVEREHDNARAALRWSGQAGQTDLQLGLASALALFWQMRGYLSEGRRWLEEALDRAAPNDALRLPAMVEAGILARVQGDNESAALWFKRALSEARAAGDRGREAALLNNLGAVALWRGEIAGAERLFTEALMAAEAITDRRRRADALGNLGAVAHYRGDVSAALGRYIECVAVWRELQNADGIADMLLNIVQLLAPHVEHRDRARAAGEEALARYRMLGEPQGEAQALASLGLLAMIEGNLTGAAEAYTESLRLFGQIENAAGEARALGGLGLIALDRGDLPVAAGHLERALRLAVELGDHDAVAHWLEGLAALRLAEGDDRRGARLYGAADALWDQIAIPRPPEMQRRFEANTARLRERLSADLEPTWAVGRALSPAEAAREALARALPSDGTEPSTSALQKLDDLLGFTPTADQRR